MRARGRHSAVYWRRRSRGGVKWQVPTDVVGAAGVGVGIGLVIVAFLPSLPGHGSIPVPVPAAARASLIDTSARAASSAETALSGEPGALTVAPPINSRLGAEVANPRRLVIPTINVVTGVVPLDLRSDGSLEVPKDFTVAGWYIDGPEPGEPGPAVIVGHLDSHDGPAVFFRLPELTPGHEIVVETADGSSFVFVVERVEHHPKDRFPTDAVYGATSERALRLITCGGTFDRSAGSYRDNLVVFARLAA